MFFHEKIARRALGATVLFLVFAASSYAQPRALPYDCGFEANDPSGNYVAGNAPGNGWSALGEGSILVQTQRAYAGAQALAITSDTVADQTFSSHDTIVWVDGWQGGVPSDSFPDLAAMSSGTAIVVFNTGGIYCLNGDGASSGTWVSTGVVPDPSGQSWYQVSLKLNYTTKRYNCYVNGSLGVANMGFFLNSPETDHLNGFQAAAGADTAYLDSLYVNSALRPLDRNTLQGYLLGESSLTDLQMEAADHNGDALIDAADLVSLNQ